MALVYSRCCSSRPTSAATASAHCRARRSRAGPIHDADRFVAGDNRLLRQRQVAFDDVQVGPAHAADPDANPDLSGTRFGRPHVAKPERARARVRAPVEDHRFHTGSVYMNGKYVANPRAVLAGEGAGFVH